MERTLSELERSVSDPTGIRSLRASFHMRAPREEPAEQRTARLDNARHALRSLSAEGSALNHRRALAALASLEDAMTMPEWSCGACSRNTRGHRQPPKGGTWRIAHSSNARCKPLTSNAPVRTSLSR